MYMMRANVDGQTFRIDELIWRDIIKKTFVTAHIYYHKLNEKQCASRVQMSNILIFTML